MSMLGSRRYALARAGIRLTRRPPATVVALLLTTLAVGLPLFVATLAVALRPAWMQLTGPAQAVVFVAAGAPGAEIAALRTRIAELPGVTDASHVPREAALADMLRRAPGGALPDLKSNPLPDSVVVTFARGLAPDAIDASVSALGKLAKVDSVQFDAQWHRQWHATLGVVIAIGSAIAIALLLLAVTAAVASARLIGDASLDEARVLALVGADPAYQRRPYAYAGALLGLAGGLLACAAVAGALAALGPLLADLATAWRADLRWELLPWPVMVSVTALAGLIGLAAGSALGRQAGEQAQG